MFLTAFTAVFLSEITGDRSLFTISSLATRFSAVRVAAGVSVALALKMAIAVMAGVRLASLSPAIVDAVTAVTFFVTAIVVWFRRARSFPEAELPFRKTATVAFVAVFLTEWCDVGQLTAAMLAARFGTPFSVWAGASSAAAVKGLFALAVAAKVRHRFRPESLRLAASAMCVVLGVLAILHVD